MNEMESWVKNLDQRTERIEQILPTLATKADLAATKADVEAAIAEAIVPLATKAELAAAIAPLATKAEMHAAVREEGTRTRRHFDVVAESLSADIKRLADGIDAGRAAREQFDVRVAHIEERTGTTELGVRDHERRLRVLEGRDREPL